MNFLLDRIKCNTIDSVIFIVSGGAARADFEGAQLMLAEHICMSTERSKSSSRRGDSGKCGRGGGGGRSGGAGILNGEWDKRGIANGDHYFAFHKLNNIKKF